MWPALSEPSGSTHEKGCVKIEDWLGSPIIDLQQSWLLNSKSKAAFVQSCVCHGAWQSWDPFLSKQPPHGFPKRVSCKDSRFFIYLVAFFAFYAKVTPRSKELRSE